MAKRILLLIVILGVAFNFWRLSKVKKINNEWVKENGYEMDQVKNFGRVLILPNGLISVDAFSKVEKFHINEIEKIDIRVEREMGSKDDKMVKDVIVMSMTKKDKTKVVVRFNSASDLNKANEIKKYIYEKINR